MVPDAGRGLDAAVAVGVRMAAVRGAGRVAVVLGDHPALRPEDVSTLSTPSHGTVGRRLRRRRQGTALLTAAHRAARWAPPSARGAPRPTPGSVTHGSAVDLPGLRVDVDDAASLAAAIRIGLGPAHARQPWLALTFRACRRPSTASARTAPGSALLDDGVEVVVPPGAARASGLRHLRVGQRVSVELDEAGRVATRVWIVGSRSGGDDPLDPRGSWPR